MSIQVKEMWEAYLKSIGEDIDYTDKTYEAWHFCNNEKDANELAFLTKNGVKQATAGLVKSYEVENEPIPKIGDLHIITDWNGYAICVIQVVSVEILPFKEVTEVHAKIEGEGDGSLDYWRKGHIKFFKQDAKELDFLFSEEMDVVFMIFKVVY